MRRFLLLTVLLPALALGQEPPKEEPKKDNPPEEVDVQKTAERIATTAQKVGDRLKDKDVGKDTRKLQDDILKDIDALLRKAQQPPPPSPPMPEMNPMMPPPPMKSDNPPPMPMMNMGGMNNQPPMPMKNMGGMGMSNPMPMNTSGMGGGGTENKPQGSGSRRPKKNRRSEGDPQPMNAEPKKEPMGMANPMMTPAKIDPNEGSGAKQEPKEAKEDPFGKAMPKRKDDQRFADLYKDVWGQLPDRLRQEMDLYYREQFMPRYSELLRQYYAAIAEQKKKGDGDR